MPIFLKLGGGRSVERKTIVFIGGTSHSGSTMLDLMISAHPKAYSLGEVHSFLRPRMKRHFNPICGCGIKSCKKWSGVREAGESQIYDYIFQKNPEIEILVDSSKNPVWIKDQIQYLKKYNYRIHHFLIWKNPLHLALSLHKRNLLHTWKNIWLKYLQRYLSVVPSPCTIQYSQLVKDPAGILKMIFKKLEYNYVEGQENYWNKKHHTIFGSAAARIHLHEIGSTEYKRLQKYIRENQMANLDKPFSVEKFYRQINYYEYNIDKLPSKFVDKIQRYNDVNDLVALLWALDISQLNSTQRNDIVQMPKLNMIWYYKLKLKRYCQYIAAKLDWYR